MTRLDSFKNTDVKNINELNALMKQLNLTTVEDEPASLRKAKKVAKSTERTETPSLRHQMLRWYNANPDMLFIAAVNLLRVTANAGGYANMYEFAAEYRSDAGSLTMHPESEEVSDITLAEDFLFLNYPALEVLANLTRPKGTELKHLITENIEKINVYDLFNALVEASRKKENAPKRFAYVDFLDVLTC